MKAIVVVAGTFSQAKELNARAPVALFPCVDRPILQRMVEQLIDHGCSSIDFILHESPRPIEEFLGDGARWGTKFTFHLVRDADSHYAVLPLIIDGDQPVLLAHADCVPLWPFHMFAEPSRLQNTVFCIAPNTAGETLELLWSGSAILQPELIRAMPNRLTRGDLEEWLRKTVGVVGLSPVDVLDFRTLNGLFAAQERILGGSSNGAQISAREIEPHIWIARNVSLHPTARMVPPVFVGENSSIGAGARVGPNAAIGRDSVIDRQTSVTHSAVLPGSYCGERLEIDHMLVDRNRLVTSNYDAALSVSDAFILSSLKSRGQGDGWKSLISRLLAAVLIASTLPILALTVIWLWLSRRASLISSTRVVRIPVASESPPYPTYALMSFRDPSGAGAGTRLNYFFLNLLPGLFQVLTGKLYLVGACPRTPAQVARMRADWRDLYLHSRGGLISEAFVVHGPSASDDEIYSSEAYYHAQSGFAHDLSLILRFIAECF